jgi:lipid-A-disaccharide synthase
VAISTRLIKRQFFALPNILAGEALVPELIQHEVTPARLAQETKRWLQDELARQALSGRFAALHRELVGNADRGAGAVVSDFLQASP